MWIPHTSPLSAANIDSVLAFIQSFLAAHAFGRFSHAATLWVFFAACGLTELFISFLICTPLERLWPLTSWPKIVKLPSRSEGIMIRKNINPNRRGFSMIELLVVIGVMTLMASLSIGVLRNAVADEN